MVCRYDVDLGSKTGYRALTSLNCQTTFLFTLPTDCILITMLRRSNVESGRRPIAEFSNFTLVYFFWYMYESDNVSFDDMDCT